MDPTPKIPIQLSRAYPEISLDTRRIWLNHIIYLRELHHIPTKIPSTYDIRFVIVPCLSHKVIQVTVREAQVLHIHECTCDIPCQLQRTYTPIVRRQGPGADLIIDNIARLFDSLQQATYIAHKIPGG